MLVPYTHNIKLCKYRIYFYQFKYKIECVITEKILFIFSTSKIEKRKKQQKKKQKQKKTKAKKHA